MSFRNLKVSIEEGVVEAGPALDPQESAAVDANLVTDSIDAAEETAAMDDAQATVEEIAESMDEVQDITENVIEPADQGEGLTEGEAASVEALFRSINRRCGLRSSRRSNTMPAKEQFGNKATRRQATRIAKESAWDKIKELWERFKTWLIQIWEKTKGWVSKVLNITSGLADGFKKLKEQLEAHRNTQYKKSEYRDAKELDKIVIGKDLRDFKTADVEKALKSGTDASVASNVLKAVEKYMLNWLESAKLDSNGNRSSVDIMDDLEGVFKSGAPMGFDAHDGESAIRTLSRDYRKSDTVDDPAKDVTGYGILPGGKILVIEIHNSKEPSKGYLTCSMITADENEGKRTFKDYTIMDLIKLCDIGYVNAKKLSDSESVFTAIADSMKAAVNLVDKKLSADSAKKESSGDADIMTAFSAIKQNMKFANDVVKDVVNIACSGTGSLLTNTRSLIANAWHKME